MSKKGKKQNRARRAVRTTAATGDVAPEIQRLVTLINRQLREDKRRGDTQAERWLVELALSADIAVNTIVLGQSYKSVEVKEALRLVEETPQHLVGTPSAQLTVSARVLIEAYETHIRQASDERQRAMRRAQVLLERARSQIVARENSEGTVKIDQSGMRVGARDLVAVVAERWTELGLPPRAVGGSTSVLQPTLEIDERGALIREMVRIAEEQEPRRWPFEWADEVDAVVDFYVQGLEAATLDRFARCVIALIEVGSFTWYPPAHRHQYGFTDELIRIEQEASKRVGGSMVWSL